MRRERRRGERRASGEGRGSEGRERADRAERAERGRGGEGQRGRGGEGERARGGGEGELRVVLLFNLVISYYIMTSQKMSPPCLLCPLLVLLFVSAVCVPSHHNYKHEQHLSVSKKVKTKQKQE